MLTADNAWWCAGVLAAIGLIFTGLMFRDELAAFIRRMRPTDWDAPATDAHEVDDYAGDIPPVIWSNALPPGGWVCAAQVDDLPGGICGWPVALDPCPSHGHLVRGVR